MSRNRVDRPLNRTETGNFLTDEAAKALFEAGCDDGSPGSCDGVVSVDFHRDAASLEEAIRSARVLMPEYDFVYATRSAVTSAYRWEGAFLTGSPEEIRADALGVDPRVWPRVIERLDYRGWGLQAASIYSVDTIVSLVLEDPCNDFASGVLPIQDARIQMLAHISGAEVRGLEPKDALRVFLNRPGTENVSRAILTVYGAALAPQPDNRYREANFALYLTGQNALWTVWHRRGVLDYFGEEEGTALLDASIGYLVDTRNRIFVASALGDLREGGAFLAVGVGHISGPSGMVELLRQEGFKVTRVPVPGEVP